MKLSNNNKSEKKWSEVYVESNFHVSLAEANKAKIKHKQKKNHLIYVIYSSKTEIANFIVADVIH